MSEAPVGLVAETKEASPKMPQISDATRDSLLSDFEKRAAESKFFTDQDIAQLKKPTSKNWFGRHLEKFRQRRNKKKFIERTVSLLESKGDELIWKDENSNSLQSTMGDVISKVYPIETTKIPGKDLETVTESQENTILKNVALTEGINAVFRAYGTEDMVFMQGQQGLSAKEADIVEKALQTKPEQMEASPIPDENLHNYIETIARERTSDESYFVQGAQIAYDTLALRSMNPSDLELAA